MKKLVLTIAIAFSVSLISCSSKVQNNNTNINTEIKKEHEVLTPVYKEVDYSESFNDINGCAIFFDLEENTYNIYNNNLVTEQIPPYSTFKIINSLMGLSQNIVTSKDSTLGYDGTVYWREQWNKDLTFEEAFKESCLWYYEKIMDSLDKEYVQKTLSNLYYGNADISAWNEDGHNTFWISSSLKISPLEQVNALATIFEGKSPFDASDVELVKSFMLTDSNDTYSVYGKTGSDRDTNAWFTGFIEKDNKRTYFATGIADESQELAGSVARDITLDIIKQYYSN